MKTDTIAAIATGMSNSGIGIVRISGDDALQVISRIYRNKKGEPKNLSQVKSHTIHYGYIYDGEERLDEVLVMIMKGLTVIQRKIQWRSTATAVSLL